MARLLCYASEADLWACLCGLCERRGIPLVHDTGSAGHIKETNSRLGAWRIEFATSQSSEQNQVLLEIQAESISKGAWVRRGLMICGLAAIAMGVRLARITSVGLVSVCILLSGIALIFAYLSLSKRMTADIESWLPQIPREIGARMKVQVVEPFYFELPRLDHLIAAVAGAWCIIELLICVGPMLGIMLFLLGFEVMISSLIIRPRLGGWRGILHAIHSGEAKLSMVLSGPVVIVVLMGVLWYVAAHHSQEYPVSPTSLFSWEMFELVSNDASLWQASPATVAKGILRASSIKTYPLVTLIAVVMLMPVVNLAWCSRRIRDWIRIWRLGILSEEPPAGTSSPFRQTEPIGRANTLLVTGAALLFGIMYWFAAWVSIDTLSYYFLGKPLLLHPIGWSLSLIEQAMCVAGLPISLARGLAMAIFCGAALPGISLAIIAIWRLAKAVRSALKVFLAESDREQGLAREYSEWLSCMCRRIGTRSPRFKIVNSSSPTCSSYRSLIPWQRGSVVLSARCLDLLDESEMKALLAHEVHHLKRGALRLELLKTLSLLLLHPVYYLAILYDFPRHEYEADAFAVGATNTPHALKAALVKLQVASLVRQEDQSLGQLASWKRRILAWLGSRVHVFQILPLYFDDSIFAAAYPTLQERIAHIDRVSNNIGDQSV